MPKDKIHPSHYKQYPIEVIDIKQELEKEKWYLDKAEELKNRL